MLLNYRCKNAILFPAAVLEPPFFDPQASAAFNYDTTKRSDPWAVMQFGLKDYLRTAL